MTRASAFTIIALLAICALAASEHDRANAGLPLVAADYQSCVSVRPAPLAKPRIVIAGRAPVSELS